MPRIAFLLCAASLLLSGCERFETVLVNPTYKSIYVETELKAGIGEGGRSDLIKLEPNEKLRSRWRLDQYARITVEGGPEHSYVLDEATLGRLVKDCTSPCTIALRQHDARPIRGE